VELLKVAVWQSKMKGNVKRSEVMQQLIYDEARQAQRVINRYLQEGWRMVPGSCVLASIERSARFNETPDTKHGTVFVVQLVAVLEKNEQGD
jgi:hypothetical protein